MSGLVSLAASSVLVALGVWLLGGVVLRASGAVLAVGGLLATASTGSLTMAAATITGAVAWLAGHWLFALRHHYFRSPLARRVFVDGLPAALDPTRRWGVPTMPPGCRR
ncbi:MAG: hypothetical protein WA484_01255 [Solirubrobacteraceae bacterium]